MKQNPLVEANYKKLKEGYSYNQIEADLHKAGHNKVDINKVLKEIEARNESEKAASLKHEQEIKHNPPKETTTKPTEKKEFSWFFFVFVILLIFAVFYLLYSGMIKF